MHLQLDNNIKVVVEVSKNLRCPWLSRSNCRNCTLFAIGLKRWSLIIIFESVCKSTRDSWTLNSSKLADFIFKVKRLELRYWCCNSNPIEPKTTNVGIHFGIHTSACWQNSSEIANVLDFRLRTTFKFLLLSLCTIWPLANGVLSNMLSFIS